jgi:4-aminobutyrate aminotransferase
VPGPKKTLLFSTGAGALENALKIARCATGRSGTNANVLRFIFPLTIEDALFDEGLSILEHAFQDAAIEIAH